MNVIYVIIISNFLFSGVPIGNEANNSSSLNQYYPNSLKLDAKQQLKYLKKSNFQVLYPSKDNHANYHVRNLEENCDHYFAIELK